MTSDAIGPLRTPEPTNHKLRRAAAELEATFLSEMLKSARLGEGRGAFGGGAGEDQFASLLRDEQARQMVKGGGLGLTEILFQSLKERENDQSDT